MLQLGPSPKCLTICTHTVRSNARYYSNSRFRHADAENQEQSTKCRFIPFTWYEYLCYLANDFPKGSIVEMCAKEPSHEEAPSRRTPRDLPTNPGKNKCLHTDWVMERLKSASRTGCKIFESTSKDTQDGILKFPNWTSNAYYHPGSFLWSWKPVFSRGPRSASWTMHVG